MLGRVLVYPGTPANEVVVYAVGFVAAVKRYYVFEHIGDLCPYSFNESEFTIVDNRISVYWVSPACNSVASFKEWVEDPEFYHKLFEGEAVPGLFTDEEAKEAIQIFQRYKTLMDLEFALPSITKYAINLESDNWVMCPTSDEAWQDENATIHEMVKCPKCCEKWLSPLKKA